MRKLLFTVLLAVMCCQLHAQDFTRKGDVFEQTASKRSSASATKTRFTWKDSKGESYPIFVTKTGSCFVNKVSQKSGKEYKKYLGEEISREICKELKINYIPKQKKQ